MSINRTLVAQLTDKLLQHALTGLRPSAQTDGVDLSIWKTGGAYGPVSAALYFDGTDAAGVGAPTSGGLGVELWGFKLAQWWLIDVLNDGAPISIVSDSLGSTAQVDGVGGFDRLFIAGAVSAGAASALFVPLEILR